MELASSPIQSAEHLLLGRMLLPTFFLCYLNSPCVCLTSGSVYFLLTLPVVDHFVYGVSVTLLW